MKNLSFIINGVLLIAVIVLYILFFTNKNINGPSAKANNNESALKGTDGGIVYVNIDTVLNKYGMYIDIQKELQDKLKASEDQLNKKQEAYKKAYDDFQYKASRQLVTRTEAEGIQQGLAQQEQELYQLQNELRSKLAEDEQVAQRKVLNSIMVYLEGLESNKNHQFVLGTTFGGNILYANKNLNVSDDIIEGLNKQYSLSKNK
jgi:outer membrane protein